MGYFQKLEILFAGIEFVLVKRFSVSPDPSDPRVNEIRVLSELRPICGCIYVDR